MTKDYAKNMYIENNKADIFIYLVRLSEKSSGSTYYQTVYNLYCTVPSKLRHFASRVRCANTYYECLRYDT